MASSEDRLEAKDPEGPGANGAHDIPCDLRARAWISPYLPVSCDSFWLHATILFWPLLLSNPILASCWLMPLMFMCSALEEHGLQAHENRPAAEENGAKEGRPNAQALQSSASPALMIAAS